MRRSLAAAAASCCSPESAGAQSPSATSTRTKTPVVPAIVTVGMASAQPGDRGPVPVSLDPGAQTVFFARNDIATEALSSVVFKRLPNGEPDCSLNPDIAANTAISRACLDVAAGGCRKTRVIVFRQRRPAAARRSALQRASPRSTPPPRSAVSALAPWRSRCATT